MLNWLTNFSNKKSAKKHGWTPQWFGVSKFDRTLIKKIKEFQKANSLWANGYCDKKTYRLALLLRLKKIRRRYRWIKNH